VALAKAFHDNSHGFIILNRHCAGPVENRALGAVFSWARSSRSAFFAGKPIPFSECVTFVIDPSLRFPLVLLGSPFAIPSSECSRFKSKNKFWPDIVQ
jgi:hypothetical protein